MQKRAIVKGTLIVLVAAIIIRILGFFFRIYVAENLGAQGMGVYQLIFSLYTLITTFTTTGITFSVSRMIAESHAINKHGSPTQILKISVWWTMLMSVAVTALLVIFAKQIGTIILREPQTIKSIYYLAPGVLFMAIAACLKGYFFAVRNATHPSNAGIIEQAVKIAVIVSLLGFFIHKGTSTACAIISLGMTIGGIVSTIYLVIFYYYFEKKQPSPLTYKPTTSSKSIILNMLNISIPIQFSSAFNAALRLVESVLIIECFKIFTHGDSVASTSLYGIIKGMALPLILFPTSFLQAFITVLVPELSSANASKNKHSLQIACEKTLQLTIMLGLYASTIFFIFANQIAKLFYSNPDVGLVLKALSVLCVSLYLQIIVSGFLNAIGEQIAVMKYNIAEAFLRIVLIVFLVPKGGFSALIGVEYISNTFVLLLFLGRLFKVTTLPFNLNKIVLKPLFAVSVAALFGVGFQPLFNNLFSSKWIAMFFISSSTGIVFLILLLCLNCISLSWFRLKKMNTNTAK